MEALEKKKPNGSDLTLRPYEPDSMLTVIERAVMSPDFDVNKMQQLLEMRERYEKNEARKAFVQALSAFKSKAITITRDKTNKQYESKYVSIGNLVNTVTPFLSDYGLSCRWDLDQTAGIKTTCIMTHVQGHSESVSMVCPPDTSGAKNPIQQIKSAVTYGRVCTFECICGLASTDGAVNLDDDGNSAGSQGRSTLNEERFCELRDFIQNASDRTQLEKYYQMAMKEAAAAKDEQSQRAFAGEKNKWLKENSRVPR